MVVNDAWTLAPWANDLYACDLRWWRVHYAATDAFRGSRWTQDRKAKQLYPALRHVKSEPRVGLGADVIHQGMNSGYQAINLAYLLGARVVILLGFDMSHDGRKAHFFGSHEQFGLHDAPDYRAYLKCYQNMQPQNYGLRVINCSRRTALECFERADLENVLQRYSLPAALPA